MLISQKRRISILGTSVAIQSYSAVSQYVPEYRYDTIRIDGDVALNLG